MIIDERFHEVSRLRWWHRIDLGGGLVTPGEQDSPAKLQTLHFPESLVGKRVLDIGTWDGFFAFEAERRGATHVLAIDSPELNWGGVGWGTRDGFDLAKHLLGSNVESREMSVLDINSIQLGEFDLVLALGVVYHIKDILGAFSSIASVTREQLILDTHVELMRYNKPLMRFFPSSELGNDPTNWWGPNPAAIRAMLRLTGFERIEVVSLTPKPRPAPRERLQRVSTALRQTSLSALFEALWDCPGRMVVHAYK